MCCWYWFPVAFKSLCFILNLEWGLLCLWRCLRRIIWSRTPTYTLCFQAGHQHFHYMNKTCRRNSHSIVDKAFRLSVKVERQKRKGGHWRRRLNEEWCTRWHSETDPFLCQLQMAHWTPTVCTHFRLMIPPLPVHTVFTSGIRSSMKSMSHLMIPPFPVHPVFASEKGSSIKYVFHLMIHPCPRTHSFYTEKRGYH